MKIPTWSESKEAYLAGRANPLERFVFEFEPPSILDSPRFREGLELLLRFIQNQKLDGTPVDRL